ncbi:MAG: hypothetical protein FJW39_16045 [Acidobacteria bacterium]|nr:hypothetical protein [Acidobacteriota bacterium]
MRQHHLGALWLLAAACSRWPESYQPPVQRADPAPPVLLPFISMGEPAAPPHFVRDVGEAQPNGLRWTSGKSVFRFRLPHTGGLSLTAAFYYPNSIREEVGPATVIYRVNGRVVDRVKYGEGENHAFSHEVDSTWLHSGQDTLVEVETVPGWTSPEGVKLGIALSSLGFRD